MELHNRLKWVPRSKSKLVWDDGIFDDLSELEVGISKLEDQQKVIDANLDILEDSINCLARQIEECQDSINRFNEQIAAFKNSIKIIYAPPEVST